MARSAAWYGFILHLYRRSVAVHRQLRQVFTTMGLLALLLVGGLPLIDVLSSQPGASLWSAGTAIRLGFAVCNILLLENLYFNTPSDARWHINLLCVALAGLFLYDLVLYADAVLFHRVSQTLFEGRRQRHGDRRAADRHRRRAQPALGDRYPRLARRGVPQPRPWSVSGVFLLGARRDRRDLPPRRRRMGLRRRSVADLRRRSGRSRCCSPPARARSRIRAILVDNFFSHRYDYRREWMRCIDTLTAPAAHTSLPVRAIRAVGRGGGQPGRRAVRARARGGGVPVGRLLEHAGGDAADSARTRVWSRHSAMATGSSSSTSVPPVAEWFGELPATWLAVPLNHLGNLIGFVVLARSRAQFKLDREVFDLLRIVGREVASRVAEQRAAQVLSQTQQLREYSQRFAFVIHDIKNVSGQLSMLLTNAEVHADNPEFQRDMLATVRASVGKITRLLTRLQADRQERSHALIHAVQRLRDIVGNDRDRSAGTADRVVATTAASAGVAIDPESFDAVVQHLLNNAIEASGRATPDPRRAAPRGAERGHRYHRRGTGHDARVHPRRVVPPVRHDQGRRARHRRLSGARTAARGGRRSSRAQPQAGRHHDAAVAALGPAWPSPSAATLPA